jgi:hypothetical protein
VFIFDIAVRIRTLVPSSHPTPAGGIAMMTVVQSWQKLAAIEMRVFKKYCGDRTGRAGCAFKKVEGRNPSGLRPN